MDSFVQSMVFTVIGVLAIVTLMVGSLKVSAIIFVCVMLTLTDVVGTMYYWGLTLETQTCVLLIICVGLSIDYSAHVGHKYLTTPGATPNGKYTYNFCSRD